MSFKTRIILIMLRVFFFSLPIILLGWLLYKDFVVSGVLEAEYDFKSRSPLISALRPQGRVSEILNKDGDSFQEVTKEPVYFDARLPRIFDTAEVTVRYKNFGEDIIELGAMKDFERWSFDLKPVENAVVSRLFQDKLRWSRIQEGSVILFQKNSRFKNIKDFLEHLPDISKIAVYNFALPRDFNIPSYKPKDGGVSIRKTLRGSHRAYTYVKDENLDFQFLFQDLNRHAGDDYVSINIYRGDESVYEDFIKIDSIASDAKVLSKTKEVKVNIPKLQEGVYMIDIFMPSDDIAIRGVTTTQDMLVFKNRVYLGDNAGYADEWQNEREAPTVLYASGRELSAKTTHVEGIQDVEVNNSVLPVAETHKKYTREMLQKLNRIVAPRNDILLESHGVFAFTKDSFFNPEVLALTDSGEFDEDFIEYVVAEYVSPKEHSDGWKENTIRFRVSDYYTKDNELHFIVSLPNLEENKKGMAISEIRVRFTDKPLGFSDIMQFLKKYVP